MTERELGLRLGVCHQTAAHLGELYGVALNVSARARLAAMHQRLLDGETPQQAALSLSIDGHHVTYNQLYQMRRGMIERGELERPRHLTVVAC